jgi:hypothetical protein
LKKTLLSLFTGSILFAACKKTDYMLNIPVAKQECELQTANPSGKSYASDSVVTYNCTSNHCGIMPLGSKNYWIYQDSIFTDGVFLKTQMDTLRFTFQKQSLTDGLVWWQSNIEVGLPQWLYASDSSFFGSGRQNVYYRHKRCKKEFGLFAGDSIRYQTSFEDAAAIGKSLKLKSPVSTAAGTFNDCLYFEKNARNYRKDQVFVKSGIGVIRYVQEVVPPGTRYLALQKISTLVSYHSE